MKVKFRKASKALPLLLRKNAKKKNVRCTRQWGTMLKLFAISNPFLLHCRTSLLLLAYTKATNCSPHEAIIHFTFSVNKRYAFSLSCNYLLAAFG